jgi:hypothetical protein
LETSVQRQIEFTGDSLTVGYGNLSASRTCTCTWDQLRRNADYPSNGYSGLGMARNDNGGQPNVTYRTFYDRALRNASGDVRQNPGTWRPPGRGGQPRHQRLLDRHQPVDHDETIDGDMAHFYLLIQP